MTSSNDEIHILAKEKIVLQAGQSSVTLEGGNITFACPGKFSVKGSGQAFMGPENSPAELTALPSTSVAAVPQPTDAPSLICIYSQALGFEEYPFQWLPHTFKCVHATTTTGIQESDTPPSDSRFTRSFATRVKTEFRYALTLDTQWKIEQSIDIADGNHELDENQEEA